ncbi:MAG: 4Fe-4S dicluster domain-containing protein [Actinomycetaceae bacterium]|nr:4Fe-4S dicluster domain-containing protein [Actinomycetaceae bacterium]
MSIETARLLRWISDEEPEVTLLCASSNRTYPRSSTPVRLPGCISEADYALVPEMLACGAPKVLIDLESCNCRATEAPVESDPSEKPQQSPVNQVEASGSDAEQANGGRPADEGQPNDATGMAHENRQAGSLKDLAAQRTQSWRGLLGDKVLIFEGEEPRFRKAEVILAAAAPLSRRALFGLGSESNLPVDPSLSADERLLNALEVLGVAPERADKFAPAPEAAALQANGCTACGVCVAACPTGSLTLTTTTASGHDVTVLEHNRTTCVGAGECIRLCPESALSLSNPLSWTEVAQGEVALTSLHTAKCKRCNATYPDDGEELCPTCRRKMQDPFGYWLPPGFERNSNG